MTHVRIELENFINVLGKIIYFGDRNPITAYDCSKVIEILQLMTEKDKRAIILTRADGFSITGVVATSDICPFLLKGETCVYCHQHPSHYHQIYEPPISVLMNTSVIKIHDNVPLFVGVQTMIAENIGILPIIDKFMDLCGAITERHIAFLIADTRQNTQVRVKDLMTPNVITCKSSCSIGDTLRIICRKGFRRLPIIEDEHLIGYMTVKDIISYFTQARIIKLFKNHQIDPIYNEKVTSIMKTPVISIEPDVPITECAEILKEKNIGALPVVEDDTLVGIITEKDILNAMTFPK
ncbi:MAG: CBS domain-containing protein [Candidatus Helarchaeota archaeon]